MQTVYLGGDPREQQSTGEGRPETADVKKGNIMDLSTAVDTWNDPAKDCEEPCGMHPRIVHRKVGRPGTPTWH